MFWLEPCISRGTKIASNKRSFLKVISKRRIVIVKYSPCRRALLRLVLLLSSRRTRLSKTNQQTFVPYKSARLEKVTYALVQTKCWKEIQVMWRLKQARLSELSVSEGHGWKGKQPFLNEPLKEGPLYLGFIIFIVNPSQPSSASHWYRATAAKHAIIREPKSQGWKIPQ